MTTDLLDWAQAGEGEALGQLVDPYRRELQVHCYRILGSVHDAEDALQETLLPAWQGLAGFEGRASASTSVTGRPASPIRSGCWSSPCPAPGSAP